MPDFTESTGGTEVPAEAPEITTPTEGVNSFTNIAENVIQNVQDAEITPDGYNATQEASLQQPIIDSAVEMARSDVVAKEAELKIAANEKASPEVKNLAITAIRGVSKFAAWRERVFSQRAEKARNIVAGITDTLGKKAEVLGEAFGAETAGLISTAGDLKRHEKVAEISPNVPANLAARDSAEENLGVTGFNLERRAEQLDALVEGSAEARRWEKAITRSEKYARKAEFWGKLSSGLNTLVKRFSPEGSQSLGSLQESRIEDLQKVQTAEMERRRNAEETYNQSVDNMQKVSMTGL